MVPFPGTRSVTVGALGRVYGVNTNGSEGSLLPASLLARTTMLYSWPFVRSDRMSG